MCLSVISKVMYVVEKLTACFAVLALLTCVVATLIFTLGFGIGLGYNYCFVDLKSIKKSIPAERRNALRNERPMYPYPPHRYPTYRTTTQIVTTKDPSSPQVRVYTTIKIFRIGNKDLIGGFKSYDEDIHRDVYENITLGSEPNTVRGKANTVTPTRANLSIPHEQSFEKLRMSFKDLVGGFKNDNDEKNKNINAESGPRTVEDSSTVLAMLNAALHKWNESKTSIPELQPRRTKIDDIETGLGMGNVIFDYNNNDDFTKTSDKHVRTLNNDSKNYNRTLVTKSPYIPVYAPNYNFKTSDKVNEIEYYVVHNGTIAKSNEKIVENSGRTQEVVPVSKLDFLRLLSKLAAHNKTYSLQVVF